MVTIALDLRKQQRSFQFFLSFRIDADTLEAKLVEIFQFFLSFSRDNVNGDNIMVEAEPFNSF